MVAALFLSYDQSLKEYEGQDFRKVIIDFILDAEPACQVLKSEVKSTLYFTTEIKGPFSTWLELFKNKFGTEFHFTLARVFVNPEDKSFLIDSNPDIDIMNEFDGFVNKKKGIE